jgi:hypothetical protein
MKFRLSRRLMFSAFCSVVLAAGSAGIWTVAPGFAQSSLSPNAFLANPAQILTQNQEGGPQLVSLIRTLAAADPSTLPAILGLLANASKDQKAAIGAGLAQAARIVLRTNPVYANDIQQAIAKTKDQDVVLAFTAASGDQPTGATGGAGGAAGSSGGSGGQTSPLNGPATSTGSAQSIGSAGVNTGPFSITSSVSGASTTTSGTTGISNSVSP